MNLANVEKKRKEMYDAVDKIINAHVNSMKIHNARLDDEVKREEDTAEREESALREMLETFHETTMVGLDFIEYYEELQLKADALHSIDLSKCRSKQVYIEGKVVLKDLRTMIGDVKDANTNELGTEQISCFQHKRTDIVTISPTSREAAWLTYWNAKEFTSLRQDGQHIESVPKTVGTHSFIVQNQNQNFLLCNKEGKNILQVKTTGEISEVMNVAPLLPRFIGHALGDNILVSLVDEPLGYRTEKSQRKVQMLSIGSDVLHSYEYGEDGNTPIFTRPARVTQNYNSDVCVVNDYEITKGNWRGNVNVFYENGRLRFVYSGHVREFYPSGICCDSL